MKKGILYGVGVGCGDKELVTVKAVRIMQSADYVAVPLVENGDMTAYSIVKDYIADKEILPFKMIMSKDYEKLYQSYKNIATELAQYLDKGKNIAFLTLGDPSIYSTYMQINKIVEEMGYKTEIIPGITSFSASAAKLHLSLCERNEPLFILPYGNKDLEKYIDMPGNKVIMKTGRNFSKLYDILDNKKLLDNASMVQCCGMDNEKIYKNMADAENSESYFSVVFIKE